MGIGSFWPKKVIDVSGSPAAWIMRILTRNAARALVVDERCTGADAPNAEKFAGADYAVALATDAANAVKPSLAS
jgi:hypothetical protein